MSRRHAAAMETEQIDAMARSELWRPTWRRRRAADSVHQIGDSSELGNTFPLLLMVSQKALQEKAEAIKAAVRAIQRAWNTSTSIMGKCRLLRQ